MEAGDGVPKLEGPVSSVEAEGADHSVGASRREFSYEADQSARLTPKGKDGRSAANAALYFTSYIKGFVTQIWIIGH